MKHAGKLTCVAMLFLSTVAGRCAVAADTNTPPDTAAAVRAAKVVRIEVKQEFQEAPDIKLPFAAIARDIFALVGQQIVETGDTPVVLRVEAGGGPAGGDYTGDFTGYHYSGASLEGNLTLEMDKKKVASVEFAKEVRPPFVIHRSYKRPSDAPFAGTLGGYRKGLFELLAQTHGLDPLVAAARTGKTWDLREAAILALGDTDKPEAVPPLVALLAQTTQHQKPARAVIALALGRLRDARALPALIEAMDQEGEASLSDVDPKDEHWRETLDFALGMPDEEMPNEDETDARKCVLGAIMAIESTNKVEQLVTTLRDERSELRRLGAALLLGSTKAKDAAPALIEALRDKSFAVRAVAASALGDIGDASAVDALSAAGKDVSPIVRELAAEALDEISETHGRGELLRKAIAPDVPAPKDIPVDELAEALRTGNGLQRREAVELLAWSRDPRAPELLATALKDELTPVRLAAVDQLRGVKEPRARELLLKAVKDTDPSVRFRAADALLDFEPTAEMLDAYAELLKDEEPTVRLSAVEALGRIREPRSVELLAARLRDEDESDSARESIVNALGELNATNAVPALLELLKDSSDPVLPIAAAVVGDLGDKRAVELLIALLRDRRTSDREGIVRALGKLGDARAVEPLIALLEAEERAKPSGPDSEMSDFESEESSEVSAAPEALTAITKENFTTAAEWRRWWTENREKFKAKP
jgi:HEAT repeat protein